MDCGRADFGVMKLVLDLLRHGEALPAGSGGDRNRDLSPAGTRGVAGVGALLAAESWRPDRVFSSPYRRAEASARLALEAVDAVCTVWSTIVSSRCDASVALALWFAAASCEAVRCRSADVNACWA